MDEEGHLKIADFGLATNNMWLGEKIEEDWETGTPSYMAPEVSPIASLTNNKSSEIIVSGLGYRMIAELFLIPFTVKENASTRAHEHEETSTRAHEHTSTRACTRARILSQKIRQISDQAR